MTFALDSALTPLVPSGTAGSTGPTGPTGPTGATGPAPAGTGLVYATGGVASIQGYTDYWVPDPYVWADTGVTAPTAATAVFRAGSTIYLFGGVASATGVPTSKIYSAAYDASGITPTFVDTGSTMPGAAAFMRVALIDGATPRLYSFGADGNTTAIWSATMAAPLVWAATGFAIDARRDSTQVIVAGGRIWLPGGDSTGGGSGRNTIGYASTSAPTTWVTSGAVLPFSTWSGYAFARDDGEIFFGGGQAAGVGVQLARWNARQGVPTLEVGYNANASLDSLTNSPVVFDCGTEWAMAGVSNSKKAYTSKKGGEIVTGGWQRQGQIFSSNQHDTSVGWIGGDGRAYYIDYDTYRIWRSGRRQIAVPDGSNYTVAGDDYQPLSGFYTDTGEPGIVSRMVRMGNAPWLTDRVTAY